MSENESNTAAENPRPSDLDELPARPIRTRILRELLWAPELERYLDVGKMDFSMLDQIESVKVRIERGLQLLDSRLLAVLIAGLKRQMWLCAVLGVFAGAAAAAGIASTRYHPTLCVVCAVVGGVAALLTAGKWVALRRDLGLLRRLHGRYKGRVAACSDLDELLELARRVESEVRILAAPPQEPSPAEPGAGR